MKSSKKKPARKNGLTIGTVTWNDEAVAEYSPSGQVSYAFKLHLRLGIEDEDTAELFLALLAAAKPPGSNAIMATIIASHPLPFLAKATLARNCLTGGARIAHWAFRLYYDGNADPGQDGYFIEFEFTQPLGSDTDRQVVNDYLMDKGNATTKTALEEARLLSDEVVLEVLGLRLLP
ncbi:MAG: hypothetical protein NTV51_14720 [Verrucomicrobia bacterium]|nr:hypothetical protein [Verrucomicrobiota bacterium]